MCFQVYAAGDGYGMKYISGAIRGQVDVKLATAGRILLHYRSAVVDPAWLYACVEGFWYPARQKA